MMTVVIVFFALSVDHDIILVSHHILCFSVAVTRTLMYHELGHCGARILVTQILGAGIQASRVLIAYFVQCSLDFITAFSVALCCDYVVYFIAVPGTVACTVQYRVIVIAVTVIAIRRGV